MLANSVTINFYAASSNRKLPSIIAEMWAKMAKFVKKNEMHFCKILFSTKMSEAMFTISLEDAMNKIGYSEKSKSSCIKFMSNTFIEGKDYILTKIMNEKTKRENQLYLFTEDCVKAWICLARPKKVPNANITKTISDLGITVIKHKASHEENTIVFLCEALGDYKPIYQYKVKSYRIDLYFPDHKLAIECDENGHSDRDSDKENERQACIEKELECTFYRFNPDAPDFRFSYVLRDILRLLNK